MKIGYARVSTKHQCDSLDEQILKLKKFGCEKVYSQVMSVANTKRKELTKALKELKAGDTLVIVAIDRLGRSLKDLITIIADLKEKFVGFQSLKEQIDTNGFLAKINSIPKELRKTLTIDNDKEFIGHCL